MTKRSRIYWRTQGGTARAYADFRDYADVGGGREALTPQGDTRATTDADVAQVLAARRLEQLDGLRRGRALHGVADTQNLTELVQVHLAKKSGRVATRWHETTKRYLGRAVEYFGADRPLSSIAPRDVQKWIDTLTARQGRGGSLSGGTVRHHLNCLSNLYRRAQEEGLVLPGFNPAAALMEKPAARRLEARWLEVHEAALLLEAARTYKPKRDDIALPYAYALVATFLLTGGRRAEVLGLEVADVSFDRRTVTFRPTERRRLKTATSHRVVPLWPQLEEILRSYIFGAERPPSRALFPSQDRKGGEALLTDERKLLAAIAARAGWEPGTITSKMFRHTYCAARLQTLDQGAPVSPYTVAQELGHGGDSLVKRVYGHLGTVRHRAEVVEYRVEQHAERLSERLVALRRAEVRETAGH